MLTSRMEALTDGLVDLLHRLCSQSSNAPPYRQVYCRTAVETPYEFLVAVANRIDRYLQILRLENCSSLVVSKLNFYLNSFSTSLMFSRGLLRSPSFDQSAPVGRQDEKVDNQVFRIDRANFSAAINLIISHQANEDWASYDYSVSAFS